jgi:superfamily II DNA or RNA helicase
LTGRGHRPRDTARMAEIIEAEISDNGLKASRKRRNKPKKKQQKNIASDSDDENFSVSSKGEEEPTNESDGTENDSDVMEIITNEEVHNLLRIFHDIW